MKDIINETTTHSTIKGGESLKANIYVMDTRMAQVKGMQKEDQ